MIKVIYKTIVGTAAGKNNLNEATGGTIFDYMMQGTMLAPYAFKVRSSIPVTVYQFNPYGKATGFTADASLMLPVNTLGKNYYHIGFYGSSGSSTSAGGVTIVATEYGETKVTVSTKLSTSSGTDKTNNSTISSMKSGDTLVYTLKQFDALSLQQGSSGETSGLYIESDKKIGVFSGHACLAIDSACDHVEEMMFPIQSWGKEYDAIHTSPFTGYDNWYYILAQSDNTEVTINGKNNSSSTTDTIALTAYSGGSTSNQSFARITTSNNFTGKVTLNAGQYTEIQTKLNFDIRADKPILVGQFMDNILDQSVTGNGDPAFILNVPREQYRNDYSFSVPENYSYDFATIISPKGNNIYYTGKGDDNVEYAHKKVDELPSAVFSGWNEFGTKGYQYGYLKINSGMHALVGDEPFGAIGYGTYGDTSYGYPIGLDLKQINNTN